MLNLAWKTELSATAKFVLIALADYANDVGECFPSTQMLAERCGMSERGVQKQIAELERSDYLHRNFRNGRSTIYTLTPERGAPQVRTAFTPAPNDVHPEQGSPPPPNMVHPTPERGSGAPERGSPITITYPSSNPQLNHQGATDSPLVIPEWLPADAWADWCEFRKGLRGKPFTPKAKSLSLRTLSKLHGQGCDPREVIDRSIERGWTGLFEPPAQTSHQPHRSHTQPLGKQAQALQRLEDMKHGSELDRTRDSNRLPKAVVALLGSDTGGRNG